MAAYMLTQWMRNQTIKVPAKGATTFHRNLEEALDVRRRDHALYTLNQSLWRKGSAVDFSSSDALSLGASGLLRAEFNKELELYPDLPPGPSSSRIMDGNYEYLEMVEGEIAQFHGSDTALFVGSGYDANVAVFCAIPRPGDAILYDELIHASAHDGIQQSQVTCRAPFRHNDPEALRESLESIIHSQPLIREGKRCVIIALESMYSMDADICPLQDFLDVASETMPHGNAQFYVDEAHATGVIGPQGRGLVCELGVEKEVAIRLHTFSKALASSGGIMSSPLQVVFFKLTRGSCYSWQYNHKECTDQFRPFYNLHNSPWIPRRCCNPICVYLDDHGEDYESKFARLSIRQLPYYHAVVQLTPGQAQENIQTLVKYFFQTIAANLAWQEAKDHGILDIPVSHDWEQKPFLSHIVPIYTRPRYSYWLVFHLAFRNFSAYPVEYPVIPKGQSRIRLVFHSNNTKEQIDELVSAICSWGQEMVEIELGKGSVNRLPKAAKRVYSLMHSEDMLD